MSVLIPSFRGIQVEKNGFLQNFSGHKAFYRISQENSDAVVNPGSIHQVVVPAIVFQEITLRKNFIYASTQEQDFLQ